MTCPRGCAAQLLPCSPGLLDLVTLHIGCRFMDLPQELQRQSCQAHQNVEQAGIYTFVCITSKSYTCCVCIACDSIHVSCCLSCVFALQGVRAKRGNRSSLDAEHMDNQSSALNGITGAHQMAHDSCRHLGFRIRV